MVRPHLELFLTGPLKDEMWQRELQLAQSRQHADDRPGRAWMFFQPIPAKVFLSSRSVVLNRADACDAGGHAASQCEDDPDAGVERDVLLGCAGLSGHDGDRVTEGSQVLQFLFHAEG